MTSRFKKIGYTTAAGLGLFIGAAGLAAAATGGGATPAPAPPDAVATAVDNEAANVGDQPEAPDNENNEADDEGINCEDGIDTATGNECDGGPAAAQADESTEAPDNETDGAEVDSEDDDAVDHEHEGDEVGENGDGVRDNHESEADDD